MFYGHLKEVWNYENYASPLELWLRNTDTVRNIQAFRQLQNYFTALFHRYQSHAFLISSIPQTETFDLIQSDFGV
jgi:hypothetical protein